MTSFSRPVFSHVYVGPSFALFVIDARMERMPGAEPGVRCSYKAQNARGG